MDQKNCHCCGCGAVGISTEIFQGATGASAYEIAVERGYEGTEAEWLESLKGKDGHIGKDGKTPDIAVTAETLPSGSDATVSKSGELETPLFAFGIPKGDKGDKGERGEKGEKGDVTEVSEADIDNLF